MITTGWESEGVELKKRTQLDPGVKLQVTEGRKLEPPRLRRDRAAT